MTPTASIFPWQHSLWARLWSRVQADHLPHALLFSGAEGVGKRCFADALMLSLCCEQVGQKGEACRLCHGCRLFLAGVHPDCLRVEPEASGQAIRVDVIRALAEFATQTTLVGRWRLILIDPASAMNTHAANALLKILEEPPAHTVFILINSSDGILPATVISRCQRMLFPLPDEAQARAWLAEQCPHVDGTAALVAGGGAPLKARDWLNNGLLALQQDFYSDWVRVMRRQATVSDVAGKWSAKPLQEKLTLRMLLDWLFLWVRDLARVQAVEAGTESWMNFYLKLQQTYSHVLAVPQLNRQLVLEDLMLCWLH